MAIYIYINMYRENGYRCCIASSKPHDVLNPALYISAVHRRLNSVHEPGIALAIEFVTPGGIIIPPLCLGGMDDKTIVSLRILS